jgi:hypothetical protein
MTIQFIEHIIEPSKLLLAWQTMDENHRTRYIVGEIDRHADGKISLKYLTQSEDFKNAQSHGFESYLAFPEITKTYDSNVLDAFMRRLPPRTRGDFKQYLEGLRINPEAKLSNFALLGYSGAKLPSDSFSLIHPFSHVNEACELLTEAAGFRHIKNVDYDHINIGDSVSFSKGLSTASPEEAIEIKIGDKRLGYVNRGLINTFTEWLDENRIISAWVEKKNGLPGRPSIYVYVKVKANH